MLIGVLSSYIALKNCSLCVLSGEQGAKERAANSGWSKDSNQNVGNEGSVTVLSIKELSTPVRAVYDSGEQQLVDSSSQFFCHSSFL